MTTPDFSIITCTLNSAQWIKQSIRSVLRQNSVSIEYIFVDGGSTDGTLNKIQSITSPYKLLHSPAAGISDAMNAGIEEATGKIIACLHSDDFYLHANVLATVAERFNITKCEWLFGRISSLIDGKLRPENFKSPLFTYQALLKGNFIPHPATFVTRELLHKAGGFNTELRYAMDYDLWLRLSLLASPVQLNFPLTAFREHEGSLSTANRMAALSEDLQVRLRYAPQDPLARLLHQARFQFRKFRQLLQMNQKYAKPA